LFFALFVYWNNTARFSPPMAGFPTLLVHRGMAQQTNWEDMGPDGCIAARVRPPQHEYLENTIASMKAAFDRGADVVEFDIHPTRDARFAVFHDRRLECRTDGRGSPREHTMDELKALDIGFAYTADGGKTYPFRGKGVGLMPSMEEVFEAFPDRSFLIDVKFSDPEGGRLLASHLSRLTPQQLSRQIVFARDGIIEVLRPDFPDLRMFSVGSIANCLLRYIGYGWTGIVPASCNNSPLFVPANIAPWLWGWPNLFMARMASHGSAIVLVGPFRGGNFSVGLDTLEDLASIPPGYAGGIWTNHVDLVRSFLHDAANRE
jgi:glycerophosphoryl diester phosphodiesterase